MEAAANPSCVDAVIISAYFEFYYLSSIFAMIYSRRVVGRECRNVSGDAVSDTRKDEGFSADVSLQEIRPNFRGGDLDIWGMAARTLSPPSENLDDGGHLAPLATSYSRTQPTTSPPPTWKMFTRWVERKGDRAPMCMGRTRL